MANWLAAFLVERWVKNGDRMLDESDLYTRPPGPDALPG
jgi:hypothetical protein